jgi:ATP-dependent helicase/nuclease subunit A
MASVIDQLQNLFGLTDEQRAAVIERERNLAVTAGAGSGKTRTLVARYVELLSEGAAPRQVIAITFTEKAAREMRSRARQALRSLAAQARAKNPAEGHLWSALDAQMDSARIGTIHSLCAEILRSHPAEARLDPRFAVVEENQAAALRAAAVESGLGWMILQADMGALVRCLSLGRLQSLLSELLSRRLEVSESSFDPAGLDSRLCLALHDFILDEEVAAIRIELRRGLPGGGLAGEAGAGFAEQVVGLLANLDTAESAIQRGDPQAAAAALFTMRRGQMRLNIGAKVSRPKEAVRSLRERYDTLLGSWVGGANAKDAAPDPAIEVLFREILPLLSRVYSQTLENYHAALDERSALDFDDLEGRTVTLFQDAAIRAHWQQEVRGVLVDEFQDTNDRQRRIILGLCGPQAGRLFVVGDARQSIYRFRGADVTVFTGLQAEIRRQGGLTINLDQTFRAHPALLAATGALLEPIMGSQADPLRPYRIPYSALRAKRSAPRANLAAPYVECILGMAEDSETARSNAAHALARRLLELKARAEIRTWDEVVLLFRASTPFPIYEQALENCGITFVTVAGSGFYDRPEVRDLLNMLRSLADPWDDQALVGLLRSPAFGISDAGLYQLRVAEGGYRSLYEALRGECAGLGDLDREHARRARLVIEELLPWVDRLPVAELLQRLVDRVDYRAALASGANNPGSARLWRNVDKLTSDAQAGGQVRVRAFLDTIATLRDIGAREGEAASEAEGAVRLMTIHKAKGLEFPLVVLADAARRPYAGSQAASRLGEAWTTPLDKLDASPLAYRLAQRQDAQQGEAEEQRLLYVALTRAQEKLIVSGHLRVKDASCIAEGWLKQILESGGILADSLQDQARRWKTCCLPGGAEWALWLEPANSDTTGAAPASALAWPESQAAPLFAPLAASFALPTLTKEHLHSRLDVRTPPARVIGELVHKALQRWLFPGDPRLEPLLRTQAQMEGLLEESLLRMALSDAESMLRRFQRHALYAEMAAALERHSELPYTGLSAEGRVEWGFMDCLYHTPQGWALVDFKTDQLRNRPAFEAAVVKYTPQLLRYRLAAEKMLKTSPRTMMCFLNVEGAVVVKEIE